MSFSVWMERVSSALSARRVALIVFVLDVLVTALTVAFVPYTEIDWSTYMEQVSLVLQGERNYSQITGATGPCVYPGGYVWLYSLLSSLALPRVGYQILFATLYLVALALALVLSLRARVPRVLLPLLVLSRRVHSIFALRLFNDAVMSTLLIAALTLFTTKTSKNRRLALDLAGAALYSLAVSIKMGALLVSPALLLLWLRRHSLVHVFLLLALCATLQLVVAWPFLVVDARAYLVRSFDLGRVFEQRWSVNWQFLPLTLFVSPQWGIALLALTALAWLTLYRRVWAHSNPKAWQTLWYSSLLAGILCARSIHFQFYAWYFWSLPLLLARTSLPLGLQYLLFALIEIAYTRYPPSELTSALLLVAHATLFGALLWNGPVHVDEVEEEDQVEDKESKSKKDSEGATKEEEVTATLSSEPMSISELRRASLRSRASATTISAAAH